MIVGGRKGFQKFGIASENPEKLIRSDINAPKSPQVKTMNKRNCICGDNARCFSIQKDLFDLGLIKYVGYTSFKGVSDNAATPKQHVIYMESKFRNYCKALKVSEPTFSEEENKFYCAYSHFPISYLNAVWERDNVTRRIDAVVPSIQEATIYLMVNYLLI
jgi:hypothetical protein